MIKSVIKAFLSEPSSLSQQPVIKNIEESITIIGQLINNYSVILYAVYN